MRFWDSSAIVPLLVEEGASAHFAAAYGLDPEMMVWWATDVECASALARRSRVQDGKLAAALEQAQTRLADFTQRWHEIGPAEQVRKIALRLLRTHRLRAADALQLAAALAARGEQASPLEFVCADEHLIAAARLEGLTVAGPGAAREPGQGSYGLAAIRAKRRRGRRKAMTR